MRITGLATGLDMDEIIKNSMKPYRIKIDQMTQKKDVTEIKQKLYRDVIKDGKDFYNKYFDIVKSDSLLRTSSWGTVAFSSSDENIVSVKAQGGAIKGNYEVTVEQLAEKASGILKDGVSGEQTITTNAGEIKFQVVNDTSKTPKENAAETIKNFNKAIEDKKNEIKNDTILTDDEKTKFLSSLNINAKYSEISEGIVFESKEFGQGNFVINKGQSNEVVASDKELIANISKDGVAHKVTSKEGNTVTLDGITFSFNDVTKQNGVEKPVKITGKTDSKDLKDKLVGFVNDYNKFMEKLNTLTMTKHDRSYTPLTADQKKEMSESEIKLWNERVENGQLYRDSDVTRIANSMKQTMRTFMKDSNLNLKKIGIKPVEDYSGTKNGTFTIDEDKLTKALEENTEGVMNLFIGNPNSTDPSEKGVLHQLKDTLDKEFVKSDSALIEKAGYEGTTSFSNNTLTKNISDYENKIKDMEKSFSRREQALYTKYATLETMMNKLNSQQSSLMSQLGLS
ncbi:flagellar filament capping protein FliD [uncultured Clostridium sp.]|uniref:flagellar filament capping protein FliD n=1 Tax=uncultured Clostridium sp. TaxID=59620 RepID=UPI0028EA5A18|nr:flagellar filament capping protein FliD [uncultured Clostridium sp.]